MKKITKERALYELWRIGELSFLLNDMQKKIKKDIESSPDRTSVIVSSRRSGKTWLFVVMALEVCLKKPNSIVKFLLPKAKDAKTIIKPLIREITETCPLEFRPEYNSRDNSYEFYNGSEIHLGGSDLSAESLRGTRADLVLVDEAGFVNDLLYNVRSILSPTIRTTRGRMVLASTPSRDPNHEFIQHFMIPYKASGKLKIYTIYDNLNFTPEIVQEIISEYSGGENDPDFRREFLCEIIQDEEKTIVPEFSIFKDKVVVKHDEIKIPKYTHFYSSMDIGHRDLTVVLFGFYNFKESCLYILDEFVINGASMTTDDLAAGIKANEKLLFGDQAPYKRVTDINYAVTQDLSIKHDIVFEIANKSNREAAISETRTWIASGRLKISDRCKHLIYHLEYGRWNNKRTDFLRLQDTPDKKIKGGHVDAIPALYYMVRAVDVQTNPDPLMSYKRGAVMMGKNIDFSDIRKDFFKKLLNLK